MCYLAVSYSRYVDEFKPDHNLITITNYPDREMSSSKRQSSKEDEPMMRVLRQRELVESMKHENEVLRLDLTRESRDAKTSQSSGAAADIAR